MQHLSCNPCLLCLLLSQASLAAANVLKHEPPILSIYLKSSSTLKPLQLQVGGLFRYFRV